MEKHLNCLSKGHRNTEGIAAQVRRLAVSAEKDGGAGPGRKRASSRVSKHSMGQAMDWGLVGGGAWIDGVPSVEPALGASVAQDVALVASAHVCNRCAGFRFALNSALCVWEEGRRGRGSLRSAPPPVQVRIGRENALSTHAPPPVGL